MSDASVAEQAAVADEQPSDGAVAEPEDWRTSLPEEIRSHASLDSISDVGSLAKSYVHAQSMIGADKVVVPGKWATEDDWSAVYDKLGRPADAESYELKVETPEGAEPDGDMLNWFRSTAHSNGLTPRQAQGLLAEYQKFSQSREASASGAVEQQLATAEQELRREWGEAYDQRISIAKDVLAQFGDDELADGAATDGQTLFGNDPRVVRFLHKVGAYINERVSEDGLLGAKTTGAMAPDEARAKLRELTAEGSPYWNQRAPEHEWYVSEAQRMHEKLSGV